MRGFWGCCFIRIIDKVRNKLFPCFHNLSKNGFAARQQNCSFQIKVIIGLDWFENQSDQLSPRFTFLKPTWTYPDSCSYHAKNFLGESKQWCFDARKQITWQQAPVKCCAQVTENFISWQRKLILEVTWKCAKNSHISLAVSETTFLPSNVVLYCLLSQQIDVEYISALQNN